MDTFKDHKLFFESLTLSNTTLEAKGSGVVEDLARIYRLVERTPLSVAPQPHHPLPHLDAIANNNGTTLPHQKSKHRPPTGIPKGEKKKARPKWCMDLFGRVVGGSPNLAVWGVQDPFSH